MGFSEAIRPLREKYLEICVREGCVVLAHLDGYDQAHIHDPVPA